MTILRDEYLNYNLVLWWLLSFFLSFLLATISQQDQAPTQTPPPLLKLSLSLSLVLSPFFGCMVLKIKIEINVHASDLLTDHLGKHRESPSSQQKNLYKKRIDLSLLSFTYVLDTPIVLIYPLSGPPSTNIYMYIYPKNENLFI